MNLKQLRSFAEIVHCDLNLSRAARNLHTSQPGLSHHVRLLEEELGIELFVRSRGRFRELTEAGREILPLARRVCHTVGDIRAAAAALSEAGERVVTIATAYTYARYLLPAVLEQHLKRWPRTKLQIKHGTLPQIMEWMRSGEADVSVSAGHEAASDMSYVEGGQTHRIIVMRPGHPLLAEAEITLEKLAEFPLITYEEGFAARSQIEEAFRAERLQPNIVLSATDVDVMKAYVSYGLGVAVVANDAFHEVEDRELRMRDARHLFPTSPIWIGTRKGGSSFQVKALVSLLVTRRSSASEI